MIKNRTVQMIYQIVFCILGFLGVLASLGVFNHEWESEFYVYFTNLSNYLCIAIGFAELIQTVKKKEDSYVDKCLALKFVGLLAILFTFIVFNFILARKMELDRIFRIDSVLFHMILPVMYIADWFLFYEKGKIKIKYLLYAMLFPICYVIYIFIRAWILDFDPKAPHIYPYFFLNLDKLGVLGVTKWVILLTLVFVAFAFLFYGIDKLAYCKNKKTLKSP